MKPLTLTLLLLIPAFAAMGQTTISGRVTDKEGEPIPGANIAIAGSYDGTSTKEDGTFRFDTYETDSATLAITFVGYKKWEQRILLTGEPISIDPVLTSTISSLDVVTIAAGSFEASDEMKAVMLKPIDIVTTAGSDADIFGALQNLPGTSTVGESEGLYVRGGTREETTYIIDELPVANPYLSDVPDIPQRGRFSPFDFKGTVFSTGGYSAQYGQALSSAVVLETQDLAQETQSNIGMLPLAWSAGHVQAWEKTSLALDVGYNNLTPYFAIFPQRNDWVKAPHGLGGSFNFRQKTGEYGMYKIYSTHSTSRLKLNFPNLDQPGNPVPFELFNANTLVNPNWRGNMGDNWSLYAGAGYTYNDEDLQFGANQIDNLQNLLQGKVMATHHFGEYSALRFGLHTKWNDGYNKANGFTIDRGDHYEAAFAEADFYITHRLAVRAGMRGEYASILDEFNVAPRLSASYKTTENSQVSLAYGHFYQTPKPTQDETMFPFLMQLDQLDYEKATHYIANFQHIGGGRTFRIEGYYKDYENLVRYPQVNPLVVDNTGDGYSTGLDLFWRDKETLKMVDYWVSYSWLNTERYYRDFEKMATPAFAAEHNLNVVVKHFIEKITTSVSATYNFASGRPYFNPNNPEYQADRTPNYHNVSLSASYLTNIFGNFTVVFLSANNILGRDNIFGYRYNSDGSTREPVKSPTIRTYMVGVFISFNHDKTKSE